MAFTKHTQSEAHEVVGEREHSVISKHTKRAGTTSASKLGDLELERMLKEMETKRDKSH